MGKTLTTSRTAPPSATAAAALEAGLAFVKFLRAEARARKPSDLSTAQFRFLHLVSKGTHTSLSEAADDLGVSPPALSKLVDALVTRGLVTRTSTPEDRRRLALDLTSRGRRVVDQVRGGLESALKERLASLEPSELDAVAAALPLLRKLFRAEVVG